MAAERTPRPSLEAQLIHPTALISPDARLAPDVTVGPYAIIEGSVAIGPGTKIGPHTHLMGPLTIGQGNRVHTGCVLGDVPQHLAYKGEQTRTEIGDFNTFREYVTVHRGMPPGPNLTGTGVTIVGNRNLFMINSHVAHDCRIGNECIFANGAIIGGHTTIDDRVLLSGNSAVHQFCRIGRLALLSGTSAISMDLPPFWIAQSINGAVGVNVIGMRRASVPTQEIQAVRQAFRILNKTGLPIPDAVNRIEAEYGKLAAIVEMLAFIRAAKRGIVTGRTLNGDDQD